MLISLTTFKVQKAQSKKKATKNYYKMKIIKNTFFSLLVLFLGTIITSCSKDDETNSGVNENVKVSNYLKSFYSTNFQLGKSVETNHQFNTSILNRSTEVENMIITEVYVGDDETARGYIITDKSTNDLLYFIDVDRVNFKLTSVKVDVNDTKVFNNINELDKYLSTDELDYIKIAEDYVPEEDTNELGRRRFWGTGYSLGAEFTGVDGGCYQGVYSNYYVFGINVSGEPSAVQVPNASGSGTHNHSIPCGTSYP